MDPQEALAGLNAQQRRAAQAVRGPVCILAGAGTGKTTTVTRRIAFQVASGAFAPGELLAVTFTEKAAAELRARLAALGVAGVRARTFHASALRQLHHLAPETGAVLPSKALWLRQIGNRLPRPYRFRPSGDLASEIEWAKNRRLSPATYLDGLDGHEPPIPAELMAGVFRSYERRKASEGRIDFEDVLALLVSLYEEHLAAAERFRAGCRAITVDEYQDVNLLQQRLLELWLGDRDELCVVGDDYQAIYGFTGATPAYLLELRRRFPHATVVKLEENYRSTPEILETANRLTPRLGGAGKSLRAVRPSGEAPTVRRFDSPAEEASWVAARCGELRELGIPYEEMAVLYRVNARSEDYERAFAAAGLPFQVRGGAFLERPAARRMLQVLARSVRTDLAACVEEAARQQGLQDGPGDGLGDEEASRQEDLRRLVTLARELEDGTKTAADLAADLRARFASDGDGRGVQLSTIHRVKGLEFEAVFLVRLEQGELPWKRARSAEALAEERRLLYVGITRAKRWLHFSLTAAGRPSRYLAELGLAPAEPERRARGRGSVRADDSPAARALREWRRRRSAADEVPAYVVFHDATLAELAERRPRSLGELARIPGIGPVKLERYGREILETLEAVLEP